MCGQRIGVDHGSHSSAWGRRFADRLSRAQRFAGACDSDLDVRARVHVYPTSIRATGVAYSAAIGRTGGLLSSVFGSYFIQLGAHSYWLALALAMVCTTAGLAWVRSHYPAIRIATVRG